jgi:hypothetical protein
LGDERDLMNQLLQSWHSSLRIFIPENFKLFFLVTAKAYDSARKLVPVMATVGLIMGLFLGKILSGPLIALVLYGAVFVGALATRPSIARKDSAYFLHYFMTYAVSSFLIFLCIWAVQLLLSYFNIWHVVQFVSLVPLSLFFAFFLFDSRGLVDGAKVLIRGIKLYVYNLPFCIISSSLFFYGGVYGFNALFVFSVNNQPFLFFLFLFTELYALFIITFFATFYIKQVHDQFNLYY